MYSSNNNKSVLFFYIILLSYTEVLLGPNTDNLRHIGNLVQQELLLLVCVTMLY